ncbi:MAG: hypothetical protein AB7O38_06305 [Pirellulaceae bacterium]
MTSCALDTSVPDWIIKPPETLAVFRELRKVFGVCLAGTACRGASLRQVHRERLVLAYHPAEILSLLTAMAKPIV